VIGIVVLLVVIVFRKFCRMVCGRLDVLLE